MAAPDVENIITVIKILIEFTVDEIRQKCYYKFRRQ